MFCKTVYADHLKTFMGGASFFDGDEHVVRRSYSADA
jgi:hypothetical protein